MTWREFSIHIKASEAMELKEWHRTRAVMHMIYMMLTQDKVKKKPEQILRLPDDPKPDRGQPISEQDVLRAIKLYSNNGNGNPTA
jgi:hypothetical protein